MFVFTFIYYTCTWNGWLSSACSDTMSASSWWALAITFRDERMVINVRNSSPVTSAMACSRTENNRYTETQVTLANGRLLHLVQLKPLARVLNKNLDSSPSMGHANILTKLWNCSSVVGVGKELWFQLIRYKHHEQCNNTSQVWVIMPFILLAERLSSPTTVWACKRTSKNSV